MCEGVQSAGQYLVMHSQLLGLLAMTDCRELRVTRSST